MITESDLFPELSSYHGILRLIDLFSSQTSGYFSKSWFSCSHMVVKTLLYCTRKCGCKGGCMSASCFLQPTRIRKIHLLNGNFLLITIMGPIACTCSISCSLTSKFNATRSWFSKDVIDPHWFFIATIIVPPAVPINTTRFEWGAILTRSMTCNGTLASRADTVWECIISDWKWDTRSILGKVKFNQIYATDLPKWCTIIWLVPDPYN